jgi:hypothetical protein
MRYFNQLRIRFRLAGLKGICGLDLEEYSVLRDLKVSHLSRITKVIKKLGKFEVPPTVEVIDTLIRVMVRDEQLPKTLATLPAQELHNGVQQILALQSEMTNAIFANRGKVSPQPSTFQAKFGVSDMEVQELEKDFPAAIKDYLTGLKSDVEYSTVAVQMFDQLAPMLQSQLPAGCKLLRSQCLGALDSILKKGWAVNDAAKVFVARLTAAPHTFVHIQQPSYASHSSRSSAPRSVSRSEVRGR